MVGGISNLFRTYFNEESSIYYYYKQFYMLSKKISKHGQQKKNKQESDKRRVTEELRMRFEKESLKLLTEGLKAKISCSQSLVIRSIVPYVCKYFIG